MSGENDNLQNEQDTQAEHSELDAQQLASEKIEFDVKAALEAMLFVSEDALKEKQLSSILECSEEKISQAFTTLQSEYEKRNSGIVLKKTAAGWKFYTHPVYHDVLEKLILSWDTRKLSQAALETLAIVAYNQPVTRNAISTVRGVNSDGPVSSLADKGLIVEAGKLESGALLYKTSTKFLQEFGLASIKDLPPLSDFAVEKGTIDVLRARLGFSEEYMNALENAEFFEDDEEQNIADNLNLNEDTAQEDKISSGDSLSSEDDDDDNLDDIIKQSITAKADEDIEFID